MIGSATRSRLFELRRDRSAALRSAELLDRKREVLLREIARRERLRRQQHDVVIHRYVEARQKLRVARVELGMDAIEAATLAQPLQCAIERGETSVMGVRIPQLRVRSEPFRAHYGPAATTESLDECCAAFHDLVPLVVALAQEEIAVERLSTAMRKTTKLLNALQKVVLPRLQHEIRAIVEGIEEDERDDALRRRVAMAHSLSAAV